MLLTENCVSDLVLDTDMLENYVISAAKEQVLLLKQAIRIAQGHSVSLKVPNAPSLHSAYTPSPSSDRAVPALQIEGPRTREFELVR